MIKRFLFLGLFLLLFVNFANAFSPDSGTEFYYLYYKLTTWLQGIVGLIIASVFFIAGMYRAFSSGNLLWIFFGIGAGAFIYFIPDLVTALGFNY